MPDPRALPKSVCVLRAVRDHWAEGCKMWADAHSDLAVAYTLTQAQREELRAAVAYVLHHGKVGKRSAERLKAALDGTAPTTIAPSVSARTILGGEGVASESRQEPSGCAKDSRAIPAAPSPPEPHDKDALPDHRGRPAVWTLKRYGRMIGRCVYQEEGICCPTCGGRLTEQRDHQAGGADYWCSPEDGGCDWRTGTSARWLAGDWKPPAQAIVTHIYERVEYEEPLEVRRREGGTVDQRIRSHTERLMKLTADFEGRHDACGDAWRDLADALNERFINEAAMRPRCRSRSS